MKWKRFLLAFSLILSACGGVSNPQTPDVLTVTVGDLTGTYQKPAGCNDPCPSLLVKFITTNETLMELNPNWYVNWGDGSPEEQLMEGSHSYPLGPSKEYEVSFRGEVVDGPATWKNELKVKIKIPFEVPVKVTSESETISTEEP